MARSQYVYIVQRSTEPVPVAAFTVKHELSTWLKRRPDIRRRVYRVTRLRDGTDSLATDMPIEELLA